MGVFVCVSVCVCVCVCACICVCDLLIELYTKTPPITVATTVQRTCILQLCSLFSPSFATCKPGKSDVLLQKA